MAPYFPVNPSVNAVTGKMIVTAILIIFAMSGGKVIQNMRQEGKRRIPAERMKYFMIGNIILSVLGRLIQLRSLALRDHPIQKPYIATTG